MGAAGRSFFTIGLGLGLSHSVIMIGGVRKFTHYVGVIASHSSPVVLRIGPKVRLPMASLIGPLWLSS